MQGFDMVFKMFFTLMMAAPNSSSTSLNFNSLQGKLKIKSVISQNEKLSINENFFINQCFTIGNFRMKYQQIFRLKTTKI